MRLTDGKRTVDVKATTEDTCYRISAYNHVDDWTMWVLEQANLINLGDHWYATRYNPRIEAYVVEDVECCIEVLNEWKQEEEKYCIKNVSVEECEIAEEEPNPYFTAEEIEEIAKSIRENDTWEMELMEQLCDAAGMLDQWYLRTDENFVDLAVEAAKKLGVEIM